ncbi:hypothetical protein LWI29_036291 [Acer saccharum]|uniref:Uncharacterized protein n=1 Tax=Acer saccharum TaxID=4024 RepID=A0AA39SSU2_ACESA|nr:hypothetical protein LWI29_036291 [Acer saccharum]
MCTALFSYAEARNGNRRRRGSISSVWQTAHLAIPINSQYSGLKSVDTKIGARVAQLVTARISSSVPRRMASWIWHVILDCYVGVYAYITRTQILSYVRKASSPIAKLGFPQSVKGKRVSLDYAQVASFLLVLKEEGNSDKKGEKCRTNTNSVYKAVEKASYSTWAQPRTPSGSEDWRSKEKRSSAKSKSSKPSRPPTRVSPVTSSSGQAPPRFWRLRSRRKLVQKAKD